MQARSCRGVAEYSLAILVGMLGASIADAGGVHYALAVLGDLAPGGGAYIDFTTPQLNDLGQVAFQSVTDDSLAQHGIFRAQSDSAIVQIAGTGQPTSNGSFSEIALSDINNAGQVAFYARLTGTVGGSSDDTGIFLGSGGSTTEVVRTGVPLSVSPVPSNEFDHRLVSLPALPVNEGPTLNDAGLVAFTGNINACRLVDGGCTPLNYDAVMYAGGGALGIITRDSNAVPVAGGGASGSSDQFVGPNLEYPQPTTLLSNSGALVFRTTIANPTGEGIIWRNLTQYPAAFIRAVGRDGQTLIPGAPGTMKVNLGDVSAPSRVGVDIDDAGNVAFVAQLNPAAGESPADLAVYRWSPQQAAQPGSHGLTQIARTGQASPDGDGVLGAIRFDNVQLNEQGQVAFTSQIVSSAFGSHDGGVLRGDGQSLALIARRDQLTPDGQWRFGAGDDPGFRSAAINDVGQVAFDAIIHGPDDAVADALYIGDGVEMAEVIRQGSSLAGSTVESFTWRSEDGINALGQVAYRAELADGRDGVFLFNLDDIHWRTAGSGSWSDNSNWTLSTNPGLVDHVSIDPAVDLCVAGPSTDVAVRSLTVGDAGNSSRTTLDLQAGATITATEALQLDADAIVDLEILGSNVGEFARLVTGGTASLDGTLRVTLAGSFVPSAGDEFPILAANDVLSTFDEELLPTVVNGVGIQWLVHYEPTEVRLEVVSALPGDFNLDGAVDAADYVLWRANPGGLFTQNDYDVWRTHLGQTAAGGSAATGPASATTVPEPASLTLLAAAALAVSFVGRNARRQSACKLLITTKNTKSTKTSVIKNPLGVLGALRG